MTNLVRCVSFALLLSLASAGPVLGQLPGSGLPSARSQTQRFLADVDAEIQPMFIRWKRAWEADDAGAVAALFDADGFYAPADGPTARGREEIVGVLRQALPTRRLFRRTVADFTASGSLAYYSGRFSYQVDPVRGSTYTLEGNYMLVFHRAGRSWLIRGYLEAADPR